MEDRPTKKEKGDRLWYRAARYIMPVGATSYFKLVAATSRITFVNKEYEEETLRSGPVCLATLHGTSLFAAFYMGRHNPVIMVSKSLDADLMAETVRRWGYHTSRGSSSRNGKEALAEMIGMANERKLSTGLAVDAPRGPRGEVKIGIVILGRETGQPLLPISCWTTRHLQFNSWDKMIVPLPFSHIVLAFGKPIVVPKGLEREDYERIRLEVEQALAALEAQAKAKVMELKNQSPESASIEPLPAETTTLRG